MNFLQGRLDRIDGAPVFRLDGVDIPLATYAFDGEGFIEKPAVFGMRPEHVGLNMGADWPFSTEATVEVVEPMGSDTLVWTRLGKQEFAIRVGSERAPEVGDRVTIGFDPLRASLFDSTSGIRL